jgi:transcription elongation factor GreA
MSQGTAAEPVRLTAAGQKRLQDELMLLRDEHRPRLLAERRRARLLLSPDESEAAVQNVQSDLGLAERRIAELEKTLARVQVIPDEPAPSTAGLGTAVMIRYEDGSEETVILVDPLEANALQGYITEDSPMGRALLGHAVGTKVKAGEGSAAADVTIMSIEKAPPDEAG